MEITKELIETIENRVTQYSITKHSNAPDRIEIVEGVINVVFTSYHCGDYDEDCHEVPLIELSKSLDVLASERLEREKKSAEEAKVKREKDRLDREEIDRRNRKAEYLKLKAEFEPKT